MYSSMKAGETYADSNEGLERVEKLARFSFGQIFVALRIDRN